jgi:hypothetical protein
MNDEIIRPSSNCGRARIVQGAERSGLLEGAAGAQDKRVGTDGADDLRADREPVARQSAGNGRRRRLR